LPYFNSTLRPKSLTQAQWNDLIAERIRMIFSNIDDFRTIPLGQFKPLDNRNDRDKRKLEEITPEPSIEDADISYETRGVFVGLIEDYVTDDRLNKERRFFGLTRDKRFIFGEVGAFGEAKDFNYVYLTIVEDHEKLRLMLDLCVKSFFLYLSPIVRDWFHLASVKYSRIKWEFEQVELEDKLLEECDYVPSDR
jgi:hypothetical protein